VRETEIAVVGGGLAGSLAATMLGRAGRDVTLIDPFDACRPDFRAEKLEAAHVDALRRAGVLDEVLPAAVRYQDIWVARSGSRNTASNTARWSTGCAASSRAVSHSCSAR